MVTLCEKVAGSLVDADMALDAGYQDLPAAALTQVRLERIEATGAEAGFGQRLLVGQELGDFGHRRSESLGILFEPQDWQVQYLGALDEDLQLTVERFALVHQPCQLALDVD